MPGPGQASDQIGTGARIGSRCHQDAQPPRFDGDAAEREAEAADACLVQPLQVVDEERDRVGLGELRQQSPDRQGYRQGIGLALAGFGALQGDCKGRGTADPEGRCPLPREAGRSVRRAPQTAIPGRTGSE
jgi:hypothetical protein